jgi:bifunctional non-homologous end joining protein LigD
VGDHGGVPLETYRKKRDPGKTPEPFGSRGGKDGSAPRFVVQRHAARRLHYDFRLERNGALASWAVPKGVPLEQGERHLAVHVEDHPLDYADFEGEIPAGQYGAGTVEIWDRGTYELVEEKKDGGLTVRLHGARLDGTWTLVPAHLDGDPKNWLLLRKDGKDSAAGPRAYEPMLATSTDTLPAGDGWAFEPKWDGFRTLAFVNGGVVTLRSRNANDLTGRFEAVARALGQAVRSPSAVIDGEVCALDEAGRSGFGLLQQGAGKLVYVAFDVLERDGEPLFDSTYLERREALEQLLDAAVDGVLVSPSFDDGAALEQVAREHSLEGVVAKRTDSVYRPGRRSLEWRKLKLKQRQELVIAGYTLGKGRRSNGIGALVLGVHDAQGLRYAGNVGTGLNDRELDRLERLLEPLRREQPPFAEVPKMPKVRRGDVTWVEPSLVVEIEFGEWTRDGRLRAPVYLGLREDKPAADVVVEQMPIEAEIRRGRRVLKLSNLDKLFWPDEGITKGDLLAYYRDVAPVLVPHLRNRPFTMKRYPDGWQGKFFFQKDAPSHMPDWIPRAPFPASTREGEKRIIDYPLVNDDLALLWAVNMGCIDMNAWTSRADRPDRPDWIVFDLDPSADVGFPEVIEVALLVKQLLDLAGLESFPKTSGSRGIHVLVPIARRQGFDATRSFAAVIAGALERAHPGLVTTEWTKRKRRGVLVDANQNGPGKTTATVYSVRPRAGAPVSTPLAWDEVREGLDPAAFTFDEVRTRIARHGDLFEPVLTLRQSLAAALKAIGG